MKILAIDSSGLVATVAVAENNNLLGEYTINFKKTHSQTLLPMLEEVKKMIELDLDTVDAIAISGGPGSFTGLRIGSATAKGLGLALDKPLVHVPTLDALAYNLWGSSDVICPLMDARRGQVYTGIYAFEGENFTTIKEPCAISIEELIQDVNELGRKIIFLGDGADVFESVIREKCNVPFRFAPAHMNKQRAASVAVLGMKLYGEGKIQNAAQHKPDYMRLSQAERERMEKQRDFQI
ncbi:MAG: tRNA (adenosine(37)-N6)-threonylcarbamoyltransferase complex dimerization subunit type 1 TsaB [Agathobacter sp.]|nr:tRNA (adenosine(37)-N6)-threonylcarbamoyltransferase complex dimerization subunit type 1 TsaB [Agathobacter sp.]